MSYKEKVLGTSRHKEKIAAIAIIAVMGFALVLVSLNITVQTPYSAGLNLYDSDGNLISTLEATAPIMSPLFEDAMSGVFITDFEGFIKVTALINEGIIDFPDGIDIDLSFGMYSGDVSDGNLIQSSSQVWHVDPWDAGNEEIPEWMFTFDKILIEDYFDETDESRWLTEEMYSFTFKFVLSADWTTPFGEGGYRKMIPIYLVVKVVNYDPNVAVDLTFSSSDMVGGSLDVDYVPYDGLENLPDNW